MRHAVLRSKQVDPYVFFDCEPPILTDTAAR